MSVRAIAEEEWDVVPTADVVVPTLSSQQYYVLRQSASAGPQDWSVSPQPWVADVVSRLREITSWPEDWDQAGAHRVQGSAATALVRILLRNSAAIPRPPVVMASTDGGVTASWSASEAEVLLSVGARGTSATVYCADLLLGTEWEGPVGYEPEPFYKLIWRMD